MKPRVTFFWAGSAGGRDGNGATTGEVGAGGGVLDFSQTSGRSGIQKMATITSGSGAEFEKIFRGANDRFIVLNNEDRIAGGAEFMKKIEKAAGVARVESDAGFIENEKSSRKAGAEASGEVDALKFPAREGSGGAVKSQVAEADAEEEAETMADIVERSLGGRVGGFDFLKEGAEFGQGERVKLGHGFSGDPPVGGFGAISLAGTGGAGAVGSIAGQKDADMHLIGFGF